MKLSMWMIASRLSMFEPDIQIEANAPATMRSARRAYATNCVYVYASGNDAVCEGVGGRIILPATDVEQAFELVQHIFDFYNDWDDALREAVSGEVDFQKVVDICFQVFRNPITISDANLHIVGRTMQYGENDVDDEWRNLCRDGFSSVSALRVFKDSFSNFDFSLPRAQIARPSRGMMRYPSLSIPLYSKGVHYGRFSVLEKDTPFNPGFVQLTEHVADILVPAICALADDDGNDENLSSIINFIEGRAVSEDRLSRQLSYLGWEKNNPYRVCLLQFARETDYTELLLIQRLINKKIEQVSTTVYQDSIVVIVNEGRTKLGELTDMLAQITSGESVPCGISLPFSDFTFLGPYYHQAAEAIAIGKEKAPGKLQYDFYDCAVDSVLNNGYTKETIFACHPDILRMARSDDANGTDNVATVAAFLRNERNLVNAAQQLYVHRNTLVYRLKKLEDAMAYSMDDGYTREYMLLSLYILEHKRRKG